ncbi:MAG: hypothetical protein NFW04_14350 [Candidatus Accumulibacter sp.]|uniref:DUF6631 family protein n=1 Tax=Accumulibacter sp. TaxID=2053492 RepID=UPI0025E5D14D|nr:DUF6631 family protein [Accumulibacter sp.]MCM8599813.1 hypothetical protein [Accumulibacter sp.]
MATKLPAAPASDAVTAADDLAILHPDRTLVVGGRSIVIREYGFFEGLDVADRASAFIADLIAATDDGRLRYAQVRRLFGRHRAVVPQVAAQAADITVDWLVSLPEDEQELFMATWFAVNAAFFVREVLAELREAQLLAAGASAGAISSPDSPLPGTARPTSSGDAPSAS